MKINSSLIMQICIIYSHFLSIFENVRSSMQNGKDAHRKMNTKNQNQSSKKHHCGNEHRIQCKFATFLDIALSGIMAWHMTQKSKKGANMSQTKIKMVGFVFLELYHFAQTCLKQDLLMCGDKCLQESLAMTFLVTWTSPNILCLRQYHRHLLLL